MDLVKTAEDAGCHAVSSLLCVTLRTDHSHDAEARGLVETISKKEEIRHAMDR
jgi:hypothetical protein